MSDVRRRQMMGEAGDIVRVNDYPEALRIDFSTNVDNYTLPIQNYFHECVDTYKKNGKNQIYVILDDVITDCTVDGGTLKVPVIKAGSHIMYIKLRTSLAGNYQFIFPACPYIRFPYNTTRIFYGPIKTSWSADNSVVWRNIDILDPNYFNQVKNTGTRFPWPLADVIRVPKGSKQLYINNGVPKNILDKMIEVNFKYKM